MLRHQWMPGKRRTAAEGSGCDLVQRTGGLRSGGLSLPSPSFLRGRNRMRLRGRLATLAVAAALSVASLGFAGTAEARPRPHPKEIQLQVLSFNDFHGH